MDQETNGAGNMRTVCHTCGGTGRVVRQRMAVLQGRSGSVASFEPCPGCPTDPEADTAEGTGWLPGFQAPV